MLEYKEENFLKAYLELFDLDTIIIVKIPLKDKNLCIELNDTPIFDINKLFVNLEINQNYLYNNTGKIYCL